MFATVLYCNTSTTTIVWALSIEHRTSNTSFTTQRTFHPFAFEPKSLMNAYQIRIEKRFFLKNAIHPRRMRFHCNRTHKHICMKMLLLLRLLLTSPTMHIINVTLPITSLALCSMPSDHCHDIPSYCSLPTIFFFTLGVFYSAVVTHFFCQMVKIESNSKRTSKPKLRTRY